MKKDEIPDTLAVTDNYNFCDRQTDTQTDGHVNSKTDLAQRAESGKITKKIADKGNMIE